MTLYRSLVESLTYSATQTRPEIVWIPTTIPIFNEQPTTATWNRDKRVLRDLQPTKFLKLLFPSDIVLNLLGESDADWSGYVNDT